MVIFLHRVECATFGVNEERKVVLGGCRQPPGVMLCNFGIKTWLGTWQRMKPLIRASSCKNNNPTKHYSKDPACLMYLRECCSFWIFCCWGREGGRSLPKVYGYGRGVKSPPPTSFFFSAWILYTFIVSPPSHRFFLKLKINPKDLVPSL